MFTKKRDTQVCEYAMMSIFNKWSYWFVVLILIIFLLVNGANSEK